MPQTSQAAGQRIALGLIPSLAACWLISICAADTACAAARYWTDNIGDHLWSTPGNWTPKGAPVSGDVLVFGDSNHDNGTDSGFTINDIANLVIGGLILGDDTDSFTIESTAGTLSINGNLEVDHANADVGLTVQCPVIIENGGDIRNVNDNGSTTVSFNNTVSFGSGGEIDALGGSTGVFTPDINDIDFNGLLESGGDLFIYVDSGLVDYTLGCGGRVDLVDTIVSGDLIGYARGDYSEIRFSGNKGNSIGGSLRLASEGNGTFHFFMPSNTVAASSIVVRNGNTANIVLEAPGNIGTGSTVTIERGAELDLSGYNPLMGTLVLENSAGDTGGSIFNAVGTVPEFGSGAILVTGDNGQVNPIIKGNIQLDGVQIDVRGSGRSVLDILGSVQGTGFNKTGPGTLFLNGSNKFTGSATVSDGTLEPNEAAALTFSGQGALHLNGGTLFAQYLSIPGVPLYVDSPHSEVLAYTPCAWGGPVILNASLIVSPIDLNGTNAPIDFTGPISGPGGLYLQNAIFATGAVRLSGSDANTFTGPITANCQLLELDKPANVAAFGGSLIAGGPGGVELGEVRWLNSQQGTSPHFARPDLTVYSNCVVNLNNFDQDFGAVTFNGGRVETGTGWFALYQTLTVNPVGVTAIISGGLLVFPPPDEAAIFDVGNGGVDPDLLVTAVVFGPGSVSKTGAGTLRFGNNNTYSGITQVIQGIMEAGNTTALGTISNAAYVAAGATLRIDTGINFPNPINLAGSLNVAAGQPVGLSGVLTLEGSTAINVESGASLGINAAIVGNGPLTKSGAGTLTFGGAAANSYAGDTQVSGGTLVLDKPDGVNAVPGRLLIGTETLGAPPSTVRQLSGFSIVGSVTVNRGGLWDLNGQAEGFSIPDLQGDLPLTLRDGGRVQTGTGALYIPTGGDIEVIPGLAGISTITGNLGLDPGPHNFIVVGRSYTAAGPECSISANISQTSTAAQLIKTATGTLVLSGANTYTGNTIVSNGTLEIDGLQPKSLAQVYGGTLQGHGTVGPLEMNDPSGVVDPVGSPSTFICNNFNGGPTPGGTLEIYLAGTKAGAGYSQIQAHGFVTLTDLNLDASLDFFSVPGDQFKIIENDGPLGVIGAFNGLPEGFIFPVSGELFQISYVGGSGQDVVLTHLSATNQANVANWINGAGGDWNTAANWDTQTVPNGGNAVVAIGTPSVISNGASAALSQLFYNSPLCTITGSGSFTMGGLFNWQAGAFNGSGSLIANGGLHLDPPGSSSLSLTGDSLINSGAATWSASTAIILSGGAVLSNAVSGIFDCAADGTIQNGSGANLLANAGLFRKINSTGTTTIQVPFDNSGTVQVQSGTLDLAGGGSSSGNYEVSSGASLIFSAGTNNVTPSSTITGAGDFHVTGGTANLFGSITTLGAHSFSGGIINLGGNYNPGNNDIDILTSTVNFNGTGAVAPATLTLGIFGVLGGSNLVTVSGPMTWNNDSTITGSNSIVANGGLTIGPGTFSLVGRTLVNIEYGLWTNDGVGTLLLDKGAVLSNAPAATFDCVGSSMIEPGEGGGLVANAGLFRVIGTPATTVISVLFSNSALVEVQSGTLSFAGGGSSTAPSNSIAEIAVSAGATADFGGGVFVSDSTGIIDGAGNLRVSGGTANFAGTVDLLGSHTFSGGTANLTGDYNCVSNALVIAGGTANLNGTGLVAPATLTLGIFGVLGGSNLVTVSGPMTWNNDSTISGSNSVVANGGLTIGPGTVSLVGRTLVNMEYGLWTNDGVGTLLLDNGAVLSNAPAATFDCVGSSMIENGEGGGLVANAGLFRVIGAPATTRIQAPFMNNAVVEVQSGTLDFAAGGTCSAPSNSIAEIAVSPGATIGFGGGAFLVDSTGLLDGGGNLLVSSGTANLAGAVDLLGSHTFSGGTANLTGDYNCVSNAVVIAGGTANFNGSGVIAPASLMLGIFGSLGGSNQVTVNGPMTWGNDSTIVGAGSVIANGGLTIGPGGVSMTGRGLVNAGPAIWTNSGVGSILLSSGASLSNALSGTFDCVGSGIIEGGVGAFLANSGLFRTIGPASTTTIQVPFNNAGTVELDSGTLSVSGAGFTQASGVTYLNGGNLANMTPLQIMGGVLKGSGLISGSLTNAGLLHPGSPMGQITVGGAYTQTTVGSLDIVLGGTNPLTGFNCLVVSNSAQLAGTLTVSLTNGFAPAIGSQFQILSSHNSSGAFTLLNAPPGISVNYSNDGVFLVVTAPVSSSAVLQAPALSDGNFRFSLQTESNQSYTIQQNTDLSTTNWLSITNFTGDGSLLQFETPVSTHPQNFFRVRQP